MFTAELVAPDQSCFALADCNNFYASCEAVFRPELAEHPVIVLGNNDGNIIARNAAAKALGIRMASPLHEVQHLINRHSVAVCSANFALYGDLSSRVMSVLGRFTPRLDVYSIDEAFLDLADVLRDTRANYAREIRATVRQWTGITVSIGVAPTKTLAKAAAECAKQDGTGVAVWMDSSTIAGRLQSLPVGEVWGIGPRHAAYLQQHDITTAYDLAWADAHWVRRHLYVPVARTQLELRGIACLPLKTMRAAKKEVCCSRSFGKAITRLADLQEAITQYASWAAEKIRAQHSAATVVSVFVQTNVFRQRETQYHNSATVRLSRPTNDTLEIAETAHRTVERLYRDGVNFHKAGVILTGLVPDSPAQLALWGSPDDSRRRALMRTLDAINGKYGHDTVRVAGAGLAQPWRMRQQWRSPHYTTRWSDLVKVR